MFSATFPVDSQLVWFLDEQAIRAGSESPQCVDPVDHYQCYTVKEKSELDTQTVDLEDQFGSSVGVRVGKPRLLCAPVDKNGEGVISPGTHLVCYDIRSQSKPRQDVLVENQFGEQILEIGQASLLCVPSTE